MRVRFGDCVFDGAAREVRRGGGPVALTPKALQLLAVLLDRRPGAVPHGELHDLLWPGTFVSHTSLPRLVTELRQGLGDDSRQPRFIRTVHGFGYAFAGAAEAESAAHGPEVSGCALLWSGRMLPLPPGESLIGRGTECRLVVPSTRVSRCHARIVVKDGRAVLQDLGSKNGTFVGGLRVDGPTTLVHGDEIVVGPAVLVYCDASGLQSTDTGLG